MKPLIEIRNSDNMNIDNMQSKLIIGNIIVRNNKKFNKLQKRMFKYFFGIIIEDIEKEGK